MLLLNLNNISQWNWHGCFFEFATLQIGKVSECRCASDDNNMVRKAKSSYSRTLIKSHTSSCQLLHGSTNRLQCEYFS